MLWGTSSLALYIPWAGTAGPYLGISLWLWLGVLDAVQGVGLGMILLQVFFCFCRPIKCGSTESSNRRYRVFMFAPPLLSHKLSDRFALWSPVQLRLIVSGLERCSQMRPSGISQTDWKVSCPPFLRTRSFNGFPPIGSPMALPLFWIALICQLIIVLGYFWFYRKEQLGMCIQNKVESYSLFSPNSSSLIAHY
jgi:alpha-1,3-glucan synthase